MTENQLQAALQAGRDSAQRGAEQGAQLFIGGEMGIGNTTSAAAWRVFCWGVRRRS